VELQNRRAVLESTDGEHRILLALNLDDDAADLPVPGATELLAGSGQLHRTGEAAARVVLPPHGWGVFE
jgi:cyclomaltodextrinase